MRNMKRSLLIGASSLAIIVTIVASFFVVQQRGAGAHAASSSSVPVIDDATLQAMTSTIGGASPLATDRTVR